MTPMTHFVLIKCQVPEILVRQGRQGLNAGCLQIRQQVEEFHFVPFLDTGGTGRENSGSCCRVAFLLKHQHHEHASNAPSASKLSFRSQNFGVCSTGP